MRAISIKVRAFFRRFETTRIRNSIAWQAAAKPAVVFDQ